MIEDKLWVLKIFGVHFDAVFALVLVIFTTRLLIFIRFIKNDMGEEKWLEMKVFRTKENNCMHFKITDSKIPISYPYHRKVLINLILFGKFTQNIDISIPYNMREYKMLILLKLN